jgi:hypothetical protein
MLELTGLELLLAGAQHDPGAETELRRLLPESDLYVLGVFDATGGEPRLATHTLQNVAYLSAFTSTERLLTSTCGGEPYLMLPGWHVLQAVLPGQQLALNVGGWPCRTFSYKEATALVAEWRQAGGGQDIQQPSRYPARLLEALWGLFGAIEEIEAAYLAELVERGQQPALVVAVSVSRPLPVDLGLEEMQGMARAVHGGDVRVHQLGPDEFSRRVRDVGVCFFSRYGPPGPLGLVAG